MGFEDQRRWEAKQKDIKKKIDILKNGGKVETLKTISREHQDIPVTVHVVPHSHNDAGWLKTVDEYYQGTNSGTDHSSVRNILDTVIAQLDANS